MFEIGVDCLQVGVLWQQLQQTLPHAQQCGRTARCKIEAAYQFLPSRFRCVVQREYGGCIRICEIGANRPINLARVTAETLGEHCKEFQFSFRRKGVEALEDLACERYPGEFAQFGMQCFAGIRERLQLTAITQRAAA